MTAAERAIEQTRCWVENIVIAHNFCPFARAPFEAGKVHIAISDTGEFETALTDLIEECLRLDADSEIETTLLVYIGAFTAFDDFLDLIDLGNQLLAMQHYQGIYQVAHFHPEYRFADSAEDDAANCTNRSPYPTLHIIRESSMAKAVASHPDTTAIPQRNIRHAREEAAALRKALQRCRKT